MAQVSLLKSHLQHRSHPAFYWPIVCSDWLIDLSSQTSFNTLHLICLLLALGLAAWRDFKQEINLKKNFFNLTSNLI